MKLTTCSRPIRDAQEHARHDHESDHDPCGLHHLTAIGPLYPLKLAPASLEEGEEPRSEPRTGAATTAGPEPGPPRRSDVGQPRREPRSPGPFLGSSSPVGRRPGTVFDALRQLLAKLLVGAARRGRELQPLDRRELLPRPARRRARRARSESGAPSPGRGAVAIEDAALASAAARHRLRLANPPLLCTFAVTSHRSDQRVSRWDV